MTFTSAFFLFFVVLTLLIFGPTRNPSFRRVVILSANVLFYLSLLDTPRSGWAFLGFVSLGYVCVCLVPVNRRLPLVALGVVLVVGTFIVLKRYFTLGALIPIYPTYAVIGLSYVLFRILHLLVDRAQGMVPERPTPLGYAAYVAFFPALLSGPIHDYAEFNAALAPAVLSRDFPGAAVRLVRGLFKIIVVAPICLQMFLAFSSHVIPGQTAIGLARWDLLPHLPLWAATSMAASTYAVFLFFNFAGYTDMAIAVAMFFGVRLPENFDRPFRARNVAEFWSRWHMSLSAWFQTYFFNPMVARLTSWFPQRRAAAPISLLSIFVGFLVIGVWHGSTGVYVYYGLYLGAAATLHRAYQLALIRWLGRPGYKRLTQNRVYAQFCVGLTFAYFATALVCFWMDAAQLQALGHRLGPLAALSSFGSVTVVSSMLLLPLNFIGDKLHQAAIPIRTLTPAFWLQQAALAGEVVLVLFCNTMFDSAPGFVYQAF